MRGLSNQIFYLLALSIAENICGKTVTENAFGLDPAFPLAHWACPVPTCHKYWNNGLKASGFRVWQHVLGTILEEMMSSMEEHFKNPNMIIPHPNFLITVEGKGKENKTTQNQNYLLYEPEVIAL